MAKLSSKKRKALAASDFALPSKRKYPIEDASHAKNAKARASEMQHEGKLGKSAETTIDSKANRVLKGKKKAIKKRAKK